MNKDIPPPELKIKQINLEPKLELYFNRPIAPEYNASSIRIQYRPLFSLHLNTRLESSEVMENDQEDMRNHGNSTFVLNKGLKQVNFF